MQLRMRCLQADSRKSPSTTPRLRVPVLRARLSSGHLIVDRVQNLGTLTSPIYPDLPAHIPSVNPDTCRHLARLFPQNACPGQSRHNFQNTKQIGQRSSTAALQLLQSVISQPSGWQHHHYASPRALGGHATCKVKMPGIRTCLEICGQSSGLDPCRRRRETGSRDKGSQGTQYS